MQKSDIQTQATFKGPDSSSLWINLGTKGLILSQDYFNDSIHGLSNPSFTSLGPGKEISIWNLNILS